MNVSAFIKTYSRDMDWLEYCLFALRRQGKQFSEVIVTAPEEDREHFRGFNFEMAKVHWVREPVPERPYVSQQIVKCNADQYCSSDFIMMFDSDCIATKEINLPDFFVNGMPKLLIRRWEDAGTGIAWRDVTRAVLKREPCFDTMASHPFLFHRSTLELFRRHIEELHGVSFASFARSLQSFSEFNAIGNFCHLFTPDAYSFVRASGEGDGYPRPFRQFWSYGGVGENRAEIEKILL